MKSDNMNNKTRSIEKELIILEAYKNLSKNAKDIIKIIHLDLDEIQEIVGTNTGKISKNARGLFASYLRKVWRSRIEVRKAFKELEEFVENF